MIYTLKESSCQMIAEAYSLDLKNLKELPNEIIEDLGLKGLTFQGNSPIQTEKGFFFECGDYFIKRYYLKNIYSDNLVPVEVSLIWSKKEFERAWEPVLKNSLQIIKKRQMGKTTELIKASSLFKIPILTKTNAEFLNLMNQAKKMNKSIPIPIRFNRLNERGIRHNSKDRQEVLIDELDIFTSNILLDKYNLKMVGYSLTEKENNNFLI